MFYPKDRNFTWILVCCEGSLALHFCIVSFNWSLLILYTTEGVPERKHHPIISLYYLWWYKRECIHTHAFISCFFNVQLAMPLGKKWWTILLEKVNYPGFSFLSQIMSDERYAIIFPRSPLCSSGKWRNASWNKQTWCLHTPILIYELRWPKSSSMLYFSTVWDFSCYVKIKYKPKC